MDDFSVFLLESRAELNLTQKQIAQKIGVAESTYVYWERGTRFPTKINRLKTIKKIKALLEELHD